MSGCCLLSTGSWKRGCRRARGVPWYSFSLKARSTCAAVSKSTLKHISIFHYISIFHKASAQQQNPSNPLWKSLLGKGQAFLPNPLLHQSEEFQVSKCWLCFCSPSTTLSLPNKSSHAGCHLNSQCDLSHSSRGTYALSSVAGSVTSDPPWKRGMIPKPQQRC